MNSKKRITILSSIIALLLALILSITFAYYVGVSNIQNLSFNGVFLYSNETINLTYTGGNNLNLIVNENQLTKEQASNNYSSFVEGTALNINVTMTVNSQLFPDGVTCIYDIYYNPTTVYTSSSKAYSQGLHELALKVSGDVNIVSTLDNINTKRYISSGIISTNSTTTRSLSLKYLFYNLNVNQIDSYGKQASGTISLETVQCEKGATNLDFAYTGDEQTFTAPIDGTYKLEVWGAQGGSANNGEFAGGYGGYSSGTINLNSGQKLYISVGSTNGYNGGGGGFPTGGGATSIQNTLIGDGQLKNYSSNINNVIIVAGGGGGNDWTTVSGYDGSGGGYIGNPGMSSYVFNYVIYGGTQTAGGANGRSDSALTNAGFGQGASDNTPDDPGGGGGGGFYGGGTDVVWGIGAGGSGYIGNSILTSKVMYCYQCSTSTAETTKTISTTNVSETPIGSYAKQGNGYARITYIP